MMKVEKQEDIMEQQWNCQPQTEDGKVGKWKDEENLRYVVFLDFYKGSLTTKQKRRSYGVFVNMSKFIGTRNPVQCRTHHQKLQEKYNNYRKIITSFKNEYGKAQYKTKFQELVRNNPSIFQEPEEEQKCDQMETGIQTDMSFFDKSTWDQPNVPYQYQPQTMQHPCYPVFWNYGK